jgi:hypothetical protein
MSRPWRETLHLDDADGSPVRCHGHIAPHLFLPAAREFCATQRECRCEEPRCTEAMVQHKWYVLRKLEDEPGSERFLFDCAPTDKGARRYTEVDCHDDEPRA